MPEINTEEYYIARFETKDDERLFTSETGYVVHDFDIIYVSDSWTAEHCNLSATVSAFEKMLAAAGRVDGMRIIYIGFGD